MALTQDPKLTIRDLLRDEWDNTNTSIGYDPAIHTGWVNINWDNPQITITNKRETTIGGGTTGFHAIDPSGAGPIKRMMGRLSIVAWSSTNMEEGTHPKQLVYEFAREVERIVTANVTTIGGGLEWTSFTDAEDRVDTNVDPTLFRQDMTVRYEYIIRP